MEEQPRESRPTMRMPSPTARMPSNQPTIRMNAPLVEGGQTRQSATHITLGMRLNDQFLLKSVLSEQTGEAALFLCESKGDTYVAKVYHLHKKPKQELYEVLRALDHPSVLRPIADGEYEGRYYEILPYFVEGDLEKAAPIDADMLKKVVVPAIKEGLHALHQHGIVHRDVKPSNLFFASQKTHVVIGDFGISSLIVNQQSVRYTSGSRTLGYSAPETAQGFISKESDYYSLGITLLHLMTGFDPFCGMNDQQILRITMMDKLDIPLFVDPSVAHLIRGLTLKERNDRWGNSELSRWCSGENVPVVDSAAQPVHVQPYVFQGRSFQNVKELSLALADQWDEAAKHLYRGFISEHMKQFGQDLASSVMDCEEESDRDIAVFKLIQALNPASPLCWKGEVFFDLEALGRAMSYDSTKIQSNYMEMLRKKVLLQYVRHGHFDEALKKELEKLHKLSETHPEMAYYCLFYLLNHTDEWTIDAQSFYTVEAFAAYMSNHKQATESIAKRSLQDDKYWAWLIHLGYEEQVGAWLDIAILKTGVYESI